MTIRTTALALSTAITIAASVAAPALAQTPRAATGGPLPFTPLPASAACTAGGNPTQPFILPAGYTQAVFAREGDGGTPDLWDMNTLNETGAQAGRFLYRTHETRDNGAVSVTDLETGDTRILARRADWERLDGIVWTPWGTILAAEEVITAAVRDPALPQAVGGLVYEIDARTGAAVVRPAIGSRSHEGLRFDSQGYLYGISERNPGYIYKFRPDRRGDLSSGQLYALKLTRATSDRTGEFAWVELDRAVAQVDSDAAAAAVGATSYNRPEDVEITTVGGVEVLYVAITGEDRVLAVELRGFSAPMPSVSDYVRAGVNAPADFDAPDNLALDKDGNLFITEDPGGTAAEGKRLGDDIWTAVPSAGTIRAAATTVRFASLTDCDAEPTGIYFNLTGETLKVNVQHRGGDGVDLAVAITRR